MSMGKFRKNKEFEFAKLNVSKVLSQKIREYLNTKNYHNYLERVWLYQI